MNVHVSVLQEEEIKIGLESEIIQVETPGDYIPVPSTAEVGQTIVVKSVDENGKPTAWEAVDAADASEIGTRLSSLADENANLKKDLSNLAPVGAAVGQLFRVAAISEDGKYTMEPVDMLDVKINGESIVQDGVANIPIITGYSNQFGLIRIETNYNGINVNSNGQISIADASKSHIDGRNSKRAIVPTNMDYAFKAAMCDGIGAAWTSEEQAAARERMGSKGVYRHIATITIETNDSKYMTIKSDDNGNTFSLNEVCIFTYSPITDDTTPNNGYFMFNSINSLFGSYRLKGDASKPTYNMAILYCGEIKPVMLFSTGGSSGEIASSGLLSQSFGSKIDATFKTVSRIFWHGNGIVPSGTIFEIWGVDAK